MIGDHNVYRRSMRVWYCMRLLCSKRQIPSIDRPHQHRLLTLAPPAQALPAVGPAKPSGALSRAWDDGRHVRAGERGAAGEVGKKLNKDDPPGKARRRKGD